MEMPAPTYNNPAAAPATIVVQVPGDCPSGGAHEYDDSYTMCGIIWAACCFPVGLICCYAMRQSKCRKCRIIVDN